MDRNYLPLNRKWLSNAGFIDGMPVKIRVMKDCIFIRAVRASVSFIMPYASDSWPRIPPVVTYGKCKHGRKQFYQCELPVCL
ncbi:TPA: SymE family type I addiction module toxin, partial [Enterobacter chengduensis]|nr:SymE family type I addiction module toxin [Enterobacter chengduensis]